MAFIFSLFALITNFQASLLYEDSVKGTIVNEKITTFKGVVALSLGSKIYYSSNFTEIVFAAQCWLGTITIVTWLFALIFIKMAEK